MSRHLIVIYTDADRLRLGRYIDAAPTGTRVELKAAKRTLPQNDRMWAMLTDIAAQKEHCGRKYTPDMWKVLFMHACGREVQFLPSLDGQTFIPWGNRSSDLSKGEMSELIEFMMAWGTQNGVQFHDPIPEPPFNGPPEPRQRPQYSRASSMAHPLKLNQRGPYEQENPRFRRCRSWR